MIVNLKLYAHKFFNKCLGINPWVNIKQHTNKQIAIFLNRPHTRNNSIKIVRTTFETIGSITK